MKLVNLDLLTYFWGKLKAYFVKQEAGKALSTNDYTTDEKNKLAGIAAKAQVNVLESVKVNGTALTITSKGVNIDLSNYVQKGDVSTVMRYCGSVKNWGGVTC